MRAREATAKSCADEPSSPLDPALSKSNSCVLGVDLGTSALKVVAISPDGRTLASARQSYRTISNSNGQAEQNCDDWLKALGTASKKIRSQLRRKGRIEAVALTGQMPTLVVMKNGKPIVPAVTWQDSRADRWASTRIGPELRRDIYLKTGILIDGRYLAPMFRFHHASKHADLILSAKDFLFHALTGKATTDPSTASGYGLYNLTSKSWDADLCKFWNISPGLLPLIQTSSFSVRLSKLGSEMLGCAPGTPVILGCADSAAGVLALTHDEQASVATILTGSSTVIMKCDSEPHWDAQSRYLVIPLALDGTYGREADLLSSGSARAWAEKTLLTRGNSSTRRSRWQATYHAAPGADGLFFSPYLAGGEQGILWNPNLTGTLIGLTLSHNTAQIARALLEGMAYEIRRSLESFEQECPLSFVRVTGWIADIPEELQLLADIVGRPVCSYKLDSASAIGAALLTGIIDKKKYFAKVKPVVVTPGVRRGRYNALYASYIAKFH